jgi:hypothetical protein
MEKEIFDHIQKLTRIRSEHVSLRRGALRNLYVADQQYAYARIASQESTLILINNDSKTAQMQFDIPDAGLPDGVTLTDRLGGGNDIRVINGRVQVSLPGRSAAIYTVK